MENLPGGSKPLGAIPPTVVPLECPVITSYKMGRGRPSVGSSFQDLTAKNPLPCEFDPSVKLEDIEKYWIISALKRTRSVEKAANLLGMARETVYRRLRQYRKES